MTRELIAKTALRLTDANGLEKLSMRKLGSELGVEAMSLYHYVANKDDLLDAMTDCLFGEMELPFDIPDDQWEVATRTALTSFRNVLQRHSAGVVLFATRPVRTKPAFGVLHWSYRRFELVGLSPEQSVVALRFCVSYVMGHAVNEFELIRRNSDIDLTSVTDPAVRAYLATAHSVDPSVSFEQGLDILVAGLRVHFDLP